MPLQNYEKRIKQGAVYEFTVSKSGYVRCIDTERDFKRKRVEEIWEGEQIPGVTDIVRFAPSACNSQPWLVKNDGELSVYRYRKPGKRGIIPADKVSFYNCIDIIAVAQNFGTSIEGDFAKQMMWVLSEYYSKNLSKEVRKGHREIALKGLHNGGPAPFGFRVVDQKLIINELEAFYVRKMFDAALKAATAAPSSIRRSMRSCATRSMRVSMCTRWKGAATAKRGWRHKTPSGWMGRSRRSWTKIHFSRCKKSWMIESRPGRTRERICAAG